MVSFYSAMTAANNNARE